jgi:hypothetical protein
MRYNAALGLFVRERKNGVACAARLERRNHLKVFTLEEQIAFRLAVEDGAAHYRSSMDMAPDARVRLLDGL